MRFKFIEQFDCMSCGVACLQMVCRHYGKEISQEYLSSICHSTREGVSLLGIKEAATALGFQTVGRRVSVKDLGLFQLPCILHWDQKHFVVLYRIKKDRRYYIADPAKGLVDYADGEFRKHWLSTQSNDGEKGIALFLFPTSDFYKQKNQSEQSKTPLRSIANYAKNYRKSFFFILLTLLIGSVLQLCLPFLTQSIVDIGIERKDIQFVWLVLIGQMVITFSKTAIDFFRRWLLLRISMKINISLLKDFFSKLVRLPMLFFETKMTGDIMQRISDHSNIQTFLTTHTLNFLYSFFILSVFGFILLIYSKFIFLLYLSFCLIYGGWMSYFLGQRKRINQENFEIQANNYNKTIQFINTMQEIKLQNCEQRRYEEWENVQIDMFRIQTKSIRLQQIQESGSIVINELKNILITIVSATSVIYGTMTLGMMLAIQFIIGQLNGPIEQLMNFIYIMQDVKISSMRINEIHGLENEDTDQKTKAHLDGHDGISIRHAYFKYDLHRMGYILKDININIPKKKVTAIVGGSGSGKTTLIKLILGYYRLNEGEILICGNDINNINHQWWRQQCGVVMQDGVIFSESIARNIAIGDEVIDSKRLEQAARIACINDYIMELPLKYNTIIGKEGHGLSQGQKQRVLIARAVYKSPDFIFLDEATNALDAENEKKIIENLENIYKGKTVVIVAHRLSTVKKADQIIVIEKGQIIETGKHDALISKRGTYFHLVKNQLELGI